MTIELEFSTLNIWGWLPPVPPFLLDWTPLDMAAFRWCVWIVESSYCFIADSSVVVCPAVSPFL